MSDGPHKSLPMPPAWRRLAARLRNTAFEDPDVRGALNNALERDWRGGVPKHLLRRLRGVLNGHQGELFAQPMINQVEKLRGHTAGCPLAGALLDSVLWRVAQGCRGDEALLTATVDTLSDWIASRLRQLEEHCLRRSLPANARRFRNRLERILAATDLDAVARQCVGADQPAPPRPPLRKTGIDDGVLLP